MVGFLGQHNPEGGRWICLTFGLYLPRSRCCMRCSGGGKGPVLECIAPQITHICERGTEIMTRPSGDMSLPSDSFWFAGISCWLSQMYKCPSQDAFVFFKPCDSVLSSGKCYPSKEPSWSNAVSQFLVRALAGMIYCHFGDNCILKNINSIVKLLLW